VLHCSLQVFPCTYLGVPLSDRRLRRCDLQPTIDKLAAKVKGWNKGKFSLDARLLLVKHVLSAMHIFQLLVIDPPVWLLKVIDKLRRGFLWNNDEFAPGSPCLVSWDTVCRPRELGGLGIPNLQRVGTALRVRWLWQDWTELDKPWQGLPITTDVKVQNLFNAAVKFIVGNGNRIKFWLDPWLDGVSLEDYAPDLYKACTLKRLTLREALTDGKWTRHFRRNLTQQAVVQFLHIHDKVAGVALRPEIPDSVT
jgi:hypothetical protein